MLHTPEQQHSEEFMFAGVEHHDATRDSADDRDQGTVVHDHHTPTGLTVSSSSFDHQMRDQKLVHLAEDPAALASLRIAPLTEPPAA